MSSSIHLLYCLVVASLIESTSRIGSDVLRRHTVAIIGSAAYKLSNRKRDGARAGVSTFFGTSCTEPDRVVRDSFRFFWEELFSLAPTRKERRAVEEATLHGLQHLEEALSAGNGAVLLESNSFGYRSAAKQVLFDRGFSMNQVHSEDHLGGLRSRDPLGNPLRRKLRDVFESWEHRFIDRFVYLPRESTLACGRTIQRMLDDNQIVCSAGDGDRGEKLVSIPFLGGTRGFPAGIVSLSRLTGAPLIPLVAIREPGGGLEVHLEEPIRISRDSARELGQEEALTSFARVLESWISKYPGLYRNWQGGSQTQVRSPKTPQ